MPELDSILATVEDWCERRIPFALATVTGVRGSTYRGLGARQLVGLDGTNVGTVSGGCLDSELALVARRVIDRDEAEIVEFDLTADDEAVWGWGIGCNGATQVLVQPPGGALHLVRAMRQIRTQQRPAALVHTLAGGMPGTLAWLAHATVEGSVLREVMERAREILESGHHQVIEAGGGKYLIELVGSPSRLVIFGAGHDAVPVVDYGKQLGFEVTVVDERRPFLTVERFPTADELVQVEAGSLAEMIGPDRRTFVVLMSHNYLRDLEALRSLVGTEVAYVGALGPGERLGRLLHDLDRAGVEMTPDWLDRVHGPAGLDIGAEGPREIAWSVLAEIMAVRRGKRGGRLRERKGPGRPS